MSPSGPRPPQEPVLGNEVVCCWWWWWWSVCGIWHWLECRSACLCTCAPEWCLCTCTHRHSSHQQPAHTATNFTFSLRRPLTGESGVHQQRLLSSSLRECSDSGCLVTWKRFGTAKKLKVSYTCLLRLLVLIDACSHWLHLWQSW